jgi:hypothetical protein
MGGQPGKPSPPGNPPIRREPQRPPVEEPPRPIPVPPVERPPAPMRVYRRPPLEGSVSGHDVLIPPNALLQGLRLQPATPVADLESRLRCRECNARGKAVVSVRWGDAG